MKNFSKFILESSSEKPTYHYYVTYNKGDKNSDWTVTHSKKKPFLTARDAADHIMKSGGRRGGTVHAVNSKTGNIVQARSYDSGEAGYARDPGIGDPRHIRDLKEEVELDEETIPGNVALRLVDRHQAAAFHHKKNGNMKGYAAHWKVADRIEDAVIRAGRDMPIRSKQLEAASDKALREYPHRITQKEEVELDEGLFGGGKKIEDNHYTLVNTNVNKRVGHGTVWKSEAGAKTYQKNRGPDWQGDHMKVMTVGAAKKLGVPEHNFNNLAVSEEVEINEISNTTLQRYKSAASKVIDKSDDSTEVKKRGKGYALASKKLTNRILKSEEVDVNESSYRDSGYRNMLKASQRADKEADKLRAQQAKADKKKDLKSEEFELDEVSKLTLKSYIRKKSQQIIDKDKKSNPHDLDGFTGSSKERNKDFDKLNLARKKIEEAKKPKPGHNAAVMAKNISKILSSIKKEEADVREATSPKFKKGDKVHYETSKYSKDNSGVVHSHDGDQVTIKGKDWLGGDQMIQVHQGFVRKQ